MQNGYVYKNCKSVCKYSGVSNFYICTETKQEIEGGYEVIMARTNY